jgi:hypothetical protein
MRPPESGAIRAGWPAHHLQWGFGLTVDLNYIVLSLLFGLVLGLVSGRGFGIGQRIIVQAFRAHTLVEREARNNAQWAEWREESEGREKQQE